MRQEVRIWSAVGSLHLLLLPLRLQCLLSVLHVEKVVVQPSKFLEWHLINQFCTEYFCLLHSFGVDHDIPWLPCKGPKRARQTRIEVDIETGLVEIEALSLIFHHIANYWKAHLSGDCNVWNYTCNADSDCADTAPRQIAGRSEMWNKRCEKLWTVFTRIKKIESFQVEGVLASLYALSP